jgi:hypothetical protein
VSFGVRSWGVLGFEICILGLFDGLRPAWWAVVCFHGVGGLRGCLWKGDLFSFHFSLFFYDCNVQ